MLSDLEAHYYRALPAAAYRATTVAGMLRALKDPYTRYLPPNAYDQLRSAETGSYPGVGLALAREQRGLRVTASFPGSRGARPGSGPVTSSRRSTAPRSPASRTAGRST